MAALEELLHVADYLGFQVPPPALAAAATAGAGAGAAGKLQDRRHRHQQQPPRADGEDTVVGCSGRRADDDDDYDNDDPLALAERLVADARAAHGAQLRLRLLLDALQAPGVADGGRLTARAAALKQASAALAAVQRHHTALGDRLRSARTRPSVPVAPAAQPAFSALLAAAAGGGPELRAGAAALEWAVRLREAPSVWEDSLRVLLDAGREAAHELEGLRALSAALDADVGDAGVRGGGGGGGGGAAGGGGVW